MELELDNVLKANDTALPYTCPFPIPLEPFSQVLLCGPHLLISVVLFPVSLCYIFSMLASQLDHKCPSTHCISFLQWHSFQRLISRIMGVSSQPFPVSLSLKDQLPEAGQEDRNSSSYGCLWSKVVAGRGMKHKARRVLMKRRPRVIQGSRRRGAVGIKTRIRTLKRLIPRKNSESVGLEGLFRDTADYILSLQTRVRVMQVMVDVLTASDE